jgi:hypothetical protein
MPNQHHSERVETSRKTTERQMVSLGIRLVSSLAIVEETRRILLLLYSYMESSHASSVHCKATEEDHHDSASTRPPPLLRGLEAKAVSA